MGGERAGGGGPGGTGLAGHPRVDRGGRRPGRAGDAEEGLEQSDGAEDDGTYADRGSDEDHDDEDHDAPTSRAKEKEEVHA